MNAGAAELRMAELSILHTPPNNADAAAVPRTDRRAPDAANSSTT